MPYLLDSDWVIDHLDQTPDALALLAGFQGEAVYISIITYMEVFQGTLRGPDQQALVARLRDFVSQVPILYFDQAIAERCARIREAVLGGPVRPNRRAHDLMIAATAIENGLTLVTRNVDDFADVPGLMLHRP